MSSLRRTAMYLLSGILVLSLSVSHMTATAASAERERERENKLVVDVLEAKTIKVGGITIAAGSNYSGIWLSHPSVPGAVNLYITKDQGPCIGLHRNDKLTTPSGMDGYDLALTARDGDPAIQFRKKDGTLGFITVKELEKMVAAKK